MQPRMHQRAKTLLKNVQKELRSVPKMPTVKSDPTLADAVLTTPAAAIQLLRRGVRLLRGGESSAKIEAKEKKLKDYIQRVEELKETGFSFGSGKTTDYRGRKVDPSSKTILTTKKAP